VALTEKGGGMNKFDFDMMVAEQAVGKEMRESLTSQVEYLEAVVWDQSAIIKKLNPLIYDLVEVLELLEADPLCEEFVSTLLQDPRVVKYRKGK